jgi:hypothetical protein
MKQSTKKRARRLGTLFLVLIVSAGVMLAFSTGSVLAASLDMDGDSVTTDDGSITGLTVDASGDITYDGAEIPPGETEIELQIKDTDGSFTTIEKSTETLTGLAGTYSYSFSDVDIVGESGYTKSGLSPDTDGESKSTELQFRIVVTTDDIDGGDGRERDEFTSNSASATVTVNNEETTTDAGGTGNVDVTGQDNDPSDNEQ